MAPAAAADLLERVRGQTAVIAPIGRLDPRHEAVCGCYLHVPCLMPARESQPSRFEISETAGLHEIVCGGRFNDGPVCRYSRLVMQEESVAFKRFRGCFKSVDDGGGRLTRLFPRQALLGAATACGTSAL